MRGYLTATELAQSLNHKLLTAYGSEQNKLKTFSDFLSV